MMDAPYKPENECYCCPSFSWSAVFVGALVAVGLGLLLKLLTISIGLSLFSLDEHGAETLAYSGLFLLLLSAIIAMFFAGLTAGCLGHACCPRRSMFWAYGFITWCLSLILSAIFSSHLAHYVNAFYSSAASKPSVIIITEMSDQMTQAQGSTPAATSNTGATATEPTAAKQVPANVANAAAANPATNSENNNPAVQAGGPSAENKASALNAPANPNENQMLAQDSRRLASSAFLLFFLFLISALAACIGAYCGGRCAARKHPHPHDKTTIGGGIR